MPVDPQVQALLDEMRELGAKPFEELTVAEARAAAWSFAAAAGRARGGGVGRAHASSPARPPSCPSGSTRPKARARSRRSSTSTAAAGSCSTSRSATRRCARWPTAPAAWSSRSTTRRRPSIRSRSRSRTAGRRRTGTFEHAEELHLDPARIGVIGDRAGGNLAAAVALRARDEGAPKLAFQALIYPAVEHGWDTGSAHENAEGYLLQRESMHWFWDHYVPDKSLANDWRVSPLARRRPLRPAARLHRHRRVRPAARRRPRLPRQAARRRRARHLRRVRRDDPRLLLDAGRRRRRQAPARGPRGSGPRGPAAGPRRQGRMIGMSSLNRAGRRAGARARRPSPRGSGPARSARPARP